MLTVVLKLRSRRNVNTQAMKDALMAVITDPRVVTTKVAQAVKAGANDLVNVTFEISRSNQIEVMQSRPLGDVWFIDSGHPRKNDFERAVRDAVNSGLRGDIKRDSFTFLRPLEIVIDAPSPRFPQRDTVRPSPTARNVGAPPPSK